MIKSLTLTRLPRAGANSKPNHYKQKVQEMKAIPKTWVLTGKQFEVFRRKKKNKNIILTFQKPQWDTRALEQSTEYRPCKQ